MEAHRSDLLAVSERNEDLERCFRAEELAGVAASVSGNGNATIGGQGTS